VWSLLRFAEEELKHQALMDRAVQQFQAGFGVRCELISDREGIAEAVIAASPLAALLLTSMIEWYTQRHYVEHVGDEAGLDELFRDLLRFHWMDESRHARLDSLLIDEVARDLPLPERETAVEELLQLGGAVDGLLGQQVELDIDGLQRAAGRELGESDRDEIRTHQRRAYRWTFIVSGLEHPNFLRIVEQITDEGSAKLAAAASTLSS
jgi:hypothetical protein